MVVFRTGHLGDTVCAIPAFRLLRAHFRASHLTLLCDRPAGGKVAAWDVIERLELFDRAVSYQSGRGWRTLRELFTVVRQLRPDVLVQLPQVDRSPQDYVDQRRFFRLAGVRRLYGFTPRVITDEWHPNEPRRLVDLLNEEGIVGEKPNYDIPVDQSALAAVRLKMDALQVDLARPYLVFCGGGKTATQRWPTDRYASVLERLARELHLPIVAVGGPTDVESYRREIAPRLPNLRIIAEPLDLMELFEVLRFATAYVGNDTGPMHLSAAVRCPVMAVISARNKPGRWDPDVSPRLILRHRTSCEGCRLDGCVVEQHRCMTGISADAATEEMLAFVQTLLAQRHLAEAAR